MTEVEQILVSISLLAGLIIGGGFVLLGMWFCGNKDRS